MRSRPVPSTLLAVALAALLALAALTGCGRGTAPAQAPAAPAPAATPAAAPLPEEPLTDVIAGEQRSPEAKARDAFRHPRETLEFLGVRPDITVLEVWPSGGYWTEILAPYLHDHGRYIAAGPDPAAKDERTQKALQAFRDKLAARPEAYGKVEMAALAPPDKLEMVPPESVDMVLTFRNIHNWMADGVADQVFAAFFRALKPGGVLGVEEHRARDDKPQDPKARSGYVRQDYVVELARKAGFLLEDSSEVNANPKDTKDYPGGVWTLPPTLRDGEKNRDKYLAIGESDRFTLRFRKPGSTGGVGEGQPPATEESGGETSPPAP